MFKEDQLFFHTQNCTRAINKTYDPQETDFIIDCIDKRDEMFNSISLYSYVIQKVVMFLIGIG